MTAVRAFGMHVSGLPEHLLPGGPFEAGDERVVRLLRAAPPPVQEDVVWSTVFGDGERVTAASVGDGYRLRYGSSSFDLPASGNEIRVSGLEGDAVSRFLLDTVLWWLALMHGRHLLHASCVLLDGAVVALLAPSGGGKTTLASQLVLDGASFFSDDLLCFTSGAVALPGPPYMNLPVDREGRERLGHELGLLLDADGRAEAWTVVDAAAPARAPVGALVQLVRGPGRNLEVDAWSCTPLDLLPHAWDIPGAENDGERFVALADLAATAQCLRLTAPETATPEQLASLLRAGLSSARADVPMS